MSADGTRLGDLSLARRLARSAVAVELSELPAAAVAKAKICLLDFLCCAFEARDLTWSRQAIAITRRSTEGATVLGTDIAAAPGDAAFANGTLGHGLVREDMHAASIGHHGVVVWPALLALAQRTPARGGDFLAAAILGYEAGARIGRALFTADLARLFRPTGIVAPMGAAVAGARLLGLGEDAATRALSLAANTASGLNQWPHDGGSEMYFHPGFAARSAVTAVELAEAGAHASERILEGEGGLFAAFGRKPAPASIALFGGGDAEILAVYNKPVPACNFAQTACQAALRVAVALGDDRRAVEAVLVRVPEAAALYPGCDFTGPFERPLQAKMSIQYGVAAALARGVVEERNYQDLDDGEIRRIVAATRLETDAALTAAFPAAQGAEVEATLAGGRRLSLRLDDVVPATSEEVRRRFRQAAEAALGSGRMREIERAVDELEAINDAGRIAALCATAPAARPARRSARALRR